MISPTFYTMQSIACEKLFVLEKDEDSSQLIQTFSLTPHPAQYAPPSPDFKIFHYKYAIFMWECFFCPLPSFARLGKQNPPSPTGKANKKLSAGKIHYRKLSFIFVYLALPPVTMQHRRRNILL